VIKKVFISLGIVLLLSFASCGGGSSKEAKDFLQKILQLVGIPQTIVVNVCQDSNRDGICGGLELQAKVSINNGDSVDDIWAKITASKDGKYFLETYDETLPILLELQDISKVNYDNGKFTLNFNGFTTKEPNEIKELSILESMIDANFLRVEDVEDIRNINNKEALNQYYEDLLNALEQNINKLREKGLSSSQAVIESLRYKAKELLNNDIKTKIPKDLDSCENDNCIDNILTPLYNDLLITDEEAEAIKIKINTPTTITGKVKSALTKEIIQNATIKLYKGDTLLSETKSNSIGEYIFESISGYDNYHIVISQIGYSDVEYSNIEVLEHEIKHLETILQVDNEHLGIGTIEGIITNAMTGKGEANLKINFRKGINSNDGEIVSSTETYENGVYSISNLDAGNYTAEINGEGYQTTYITVTVIGGITNENQNGTINPLLPTGEIRIVLSWGEYPYDLDSHLTGPIENSNDRFHIYYGSKGNIENSPYSNLDVDDTNSYGPETITIVKKINGVYRYSVHNFSADSSEIKDNSYYYGLSNSNAKVKVFNDKGLVFETSVPNGEGTLWTVFEIEGHEVIPINRLSLIDSNTKYDDLFKLNNLEIDDSSLIINLPNK